MRSAHRFLPNFLHRLRTLGETQLIVVYAAIAFVSVTSILAVFDRVAPMSVIHTDDCLWGERLRNWHWELVVQEVIPGGNADKAGIKAGDVVLGFGNFELSSVRAANPSVLADAAQKRLNVTPLDRPIPYRVERNGRVLNLQIIITRQILYIDLLAPVLATLWLIIGLVVVLPRPKGRVQRQFFLVSASVIFAFTIVPRDQDSTGFIVLGTLWNLAGCMFFLLWLHFCTIFPVDQKLLGRRWGRILMVVLGAVGVATVISAVVVECAAIEPMNHALIRTAGEANRYLSIALATIGLGGALAFLFRGYWRLPASADRRPVMVILIGSMLALSALIYLRLIEFIDTEFTRGLPILYPQYLLPVLLLLALPVSLGYAVFRYQVMDFGRVIKTTGVYAATMTLIAALYLGMAFAVGQAVGSMMKTEGFNETVKWMGFVLFLIFFEPMKRKVQQGIENRFFPRRRDYSGRLAQYAAEVTESMGAHGVAERTAITLQQTLDLRGVCVAIEDPNDGELRPMARASEFAPVPVDDAAVESLRHLLRQSHNLVLLESACDPNLDHLQIYFPYVIGMYAQGRVTGAILMSRPHDDENLSGSQIAFITGVAAQAAAALEVARLYEEELARQRYREELATARRIQESLLPATMPMIPGITMSAISHPAQAVGGDYYDVIPVGEDRFLVTIADVSGKGLPASLYMAEFHGMVHVASGQSCSPKTILTTLNQHLFEIITRGSFITATMLLFDTRRKCVSYARAGHTPIIRRSGAEVDTLIPTGVALGLCAHELFGELLHEYTVEYEPGETFILYSDGVSEAMNEQRLEFGEGRLLDVVAGTHDATAQILRDRILNQVESFRGEAEQNDDITIVVVRVEKDTAEELTDEGRPMESAKQ